MGLPTVRMYVRTLYRNECYKVQLVSAAYLVCALTCHSESECKARCLLAIRAIVKGAGWLIK